MFRLADGFHRAAAAEVAGWLSCFARALPGDSARGAALARSARNADHGLGPHTEDKDRAVRAICSDDPEWGVWSDSEIAWRCRVSAVRARSGIVERERAAARGCDAAG